MNRLEITHFIRGGQLLVDAYRGLSRDQLLAYPVPGTWSLQQIAIHMYESDMIGCDRMKRIAAMERPLLIGYDETAFSNLPGVDDLDAQEACELFARNRAMMGVILEKLPDSAFERFGIHSESGKVTLGEMVHKYNDHLNGHLVHVERKKALLK